MSVSKYLVIGVSALLLAGTPSLADSIPSVEGARAKERAGRYLSEEDVDNLDRYGGNDDRPLYYDDGPDDVGPSGYVDGPDVYIEDDND